MSEMRIGDKVTLKPRHYWFHERMPTWMGSAFEISSFVRYVGRRFFRNGN